MHKVTNNYTFHYIESALKLWPIFCGIEVTLTYEITVTCFY